MPSKYAPPNDDGEKPYVVTYQDWRLQCRRLVYADKPSTARYRALGRNRLGVFNIKVRRALIDEVTEED